ncbi:MAG: hypothetical protein N0C84_01230 [Candidatus Thiodiazotropha taylori]|uniref:Sigma factor for late transcription n=1 Tax=Candidatus Thiodiazotropha taylori TaxID=2792791 RepID=A0A9E4N3K6_9GAMM|nr:hypothetical protein [Candidatus Thiodiazotropha taylori]MCW4255069.1 hypothetical protein [Candidatus Thiodiazotropha taylori]
MTRTRQKPGDKHYVNNKEFTLALDEYSRACRAAEEEERQPPQMSNYLGESIMKMAERLSHTQRFRGYPYRDEMVNNGVLAAVKYAHKFNGDKFDNGFAYVTQIIFSHFVITIKNEKKKYETNLKLIQQAEVGVMGNEEFAQMSDAHARSIADQKLNDMEVAKTPSKGGRGFGLKTGYTKEERENYKGGTPLKRDE